VVGYLVPNCEGLFLLASIAL